MSGKIIAAILLVAVMMPGISTVVSAVSCETTSYTRVLIENWTYSINPGTGSVSSPDQETEVEGSLFFKTNRDKTQYEVWDPEGNFLFARSSYSYPEATPEYVETIQYGTSSLSELTVGSDALLFRSLDGKLFGKILCGSTTDWHVFLKVTTWTEATTKASIHSVSGVPGKGLDTAPGLQKAFNEKSQAGNNAGMK